MDTAPKFEQASFLTSAANLAQCPPDEGHEIAFCGRSNAGKSSALNFLTGQRKLARTSKTPGRTQLLNFFAISDQQRLVDLPGYGYARVPDKIKEAWHQNIDNYLRNRQSLIGLVAVMDIRHPMKPFDQMMVDWGVEAGLGVHIILSKCDKLKPGPRQSARLKVAKQVPANVSVQVLSSTHHIGLDELKNVLGGWLRC